MVPAIFFCPPTSYMRSMQTPIHLTLTMISVGFHPIMQLLLLALNIAVVVDAFSITPLQPPTVMSASVALSSSTKDDVGTKDVDGMYLNEEQLEFSMAYLNEHHKADVLLPFVKAFSDLGTTSIKKNMWIGGSYEITDATIVDITRDELYFEASIKQGDKIKIELVKIHLDSDPVPGMARTYQTLPPVNPMHLNHSSRLPIDNFVRRMNRLCNIVKAYSATGKMIQLGVQMGGKGVGKLHDVSTIYLDKSLLLKTSCVFTFTYANHVVFCFCLLYDASNRICT